MKRILYHLYIALGLVPAPRLIPVPAKKSEETRHDPR